MRQAFCNATALATRGLRSSLLGRCVTHRSIRHVASTPAWQATLSTKQPETSPHVPSKGGETNVKQLQPLPLLPSTSLRTHTCGELREEHVGTDVRLCGWAHAVRDAGGVVFVLLRDRHGIVQVTCGDELLGAAKAVRLEYVVEVSGTVQRRDAGAVNDSMDTGRVEIVGRTVRVLTASDPTPLMVDEQRGQADDDTRLKFRYLDLRRPALQRNLVTRHRAALAARNWLDAGGFVEVETPVLTKATPEGARDYILPSRVHAGKWYALPQSPQIYKQLLMVGGMDRYFQITKCFRDEDLRADRQPEFTQIDVEMSFVSSDDVMAAAEGIVRAMFGSAGITVPEVPRMTYAEAMDKYGVDSPDLRFDMLLHDVGAWDEVQTSTFAPIAKALEDGGIVKAMVYAGGAKSSSRKVIDGYTEFVKGYGCTGLLYGKVGADDALTGPLSKIGDSASQVARKLGAVEGDLILCAAGASGVVNAGLGRLRVKIGHESGAIASGPRHAFCWVVDFPLFEWDEELGRYTSVHHPFTAPVPADVEKLGGEQLGDIKSNAYDIVCNGYEIGGGSIRIADSAVQRQVFEALGIGEAEQREKFGFLLDALRYGAPPHGGIALGLDRCCMILTGSKGIREVIAFPKTTAAKDLMAGAPAEVPPQLLEELHVRGL